MKKNLLLVVLISLAYCLQAQSTVDNHILYSSYLAEDRAISVSLPEHYDKNDRSYPVLYLLDGEYIFDGARGAVDFLTNDFGFCPEMIVVSVPNTNRNLDVFVTLSEGDRYVKFVDFLEKEVFAFTSQHYRVIDFKMLYGWSSSSDICSYFLAKKPDVVNAYILTGSGVGKSMAQLLNQQLSKQHLNQPTFMYANTEFGPRAPGLRKYEQLIDSLAPEHLKYRFEVLEESHVDVMYTGLVEGLGFVFSNFRIPNQQSLSGINNILKYYKSLKTTYGFSTDIPLGAVVELSGLLFYNDRKEDAYQLLEYGISKYPYSSTLYGSQGELLEADGKLELAMDSYQQALRLSSDNLEDHLKYRTLVKNLAE